MANLVVRVEEGAVRIEHDGLEAARGRPEARQQRGGGGRRAGQQQQDGRAHGAQAGYPTLMVALGTKRALTWRKGVNSYARPLPARWRASASALATISVASASASAALIANTCPGEVQPRGGAAQGRAARRLGAGDTLQG